LAQITSDIALINIAGREWRIRLCCNGREVRRSALRRRAPLCCAIL